MKRITLTHKATGLQVSVLSDSEDPKAAFMEALKASGVTIPDWNGWRADAWPLWPQKR